MINHDKKRQTHSFSDKNFSLTTEIMSSEAQVKTFPIERITLSCDPIHSLLLYLFILKKEWHPVVQMGNVTLPTDRSVTK